MSNSHYATLLGFVFLIYAKQHEGETSLIARATAVVLTILALFLFVYALVIA